jgi:hypothetical protein
MDMTRKSGTLGKRQGNQCPAARALMEQIREALFETARFHAKCFSQMRSVYMLHYSNRWSHRDANKRAALG